MLHYSYKGNAQEKNNPVWRKKTWISYSLVFFKRSLDKTSTISNKNESFFYISKNLITTKMIAQCFQGENKNC